MSYFVKRIHLHSGFEFNWTCFRIPLHFTSQQFKPNELRKVLECLWMWLRMCIGQCLFFCHEHHSQYLYASFSLFLKRMHTFIRRTDQVKKKVSTLLLNIFSPLPLNNLKRNCKVAYKLNRAFKNKQCRDALVCFFPPHTLSPRPTRFTISIIFTHTGQ